jgi:cytochrome c
MKTLIATIIAISAFSAHANTAETLLKSKNCVACHAVDKKLIGPAFKDVAARYTQKDIAAVAAYIRKGGSGKWGPMPMPANPQVSEAEATELAKWILSKK